MRTIANVLGISLALLLAVVWGISCQQVNYSGGSGASGTSAAAMVAEREPLPEDTLRAHGLETIWTQRALKGTIRNVHLVGDDLFAVEERKLGTEANSASTYTLIDFKREDGLRRWMWDLKAPVKHPPFVYRYPRVGTDPSEDEVLLVQRDQVYCLDYKYGTTLWKTNLPFSVASGVSASFENYFVGSYDGRVFGIPKRKEVEDWFWFTEGEVRTGGRHNDIYTYFTSTEGVLYKFHALRGMRDERAWQFRTGADVRGAPTVFGRFVYVGSSDYKLYCLRDIDGSKHWDFQAQAPIEDTPVVVMYRPNLSIVLCVSENTQPSVDKRTLWAVDAERGEFLWKFDHVDRVVAMGKESIYLLLDRRAGRGNTIVAVDGDSGAEKFALSVEGFDFVPSSLSAQRAQTRYRGILYLIDRGGLIQAIGEKL